MYENNSSYLIHSAKGTNWTKKAHKYISRVWRKGKWIYEYPITGKGYSKRYNDLSDKERYYRNRIWDPAKAVEYVAPDGRKDIGYARSDDPDYWSTGWSRGAEALHQIVKERNRVENSYYTKSLIGKGKKWLEKIFNN